MIDDAEINAMASIAEALSELEPEATRRILRWAGERFGVPIAAPKTPPPAVPETPGEEFTPPGAGIVEFSDFSDLYDAADPQTNVERALVGGYWIQVIGGEPDFRSQPVNKALKDLGHGISDITGAFDGLINQSPRLVMQKQKKGSSRQARKVYKLTTAGERRVKEMIENGGNS